MKTVSKNNLSAIILAGGQSSRMGRDKALIPIQGIPMLKRLAILAQEYTTDVYIITSWPERYQSIIPPDCHLIQEICPSRKTQGPLTAFSQALTHIKTPWIWLLACDLPNLTSPEILPWLTYLETVSEDAIALLPRHPKGWEPLCGFYRYCCLDSLQHFIDTGGRSFQSWLRQQTVAELPMRDRQVLLNCNTPQEWESNFRRLG
ncbi:molybdenum cofactor guanylyltransferase [Aphanothece sacrum]|uniref:Probable molybdenum cofactor guanylyltransferase n=1 Tax=Aphanothece sacrum FPU1 TaxID=1920663 RepID=A0A401ID20_APHSA|nr:molybdenum cofactor guanylyltransferase [Aphanothece sacrum]GBF79070.1 molybdopterin-guanine dinucleotide biosynthesis protein MobA [Aphanothece sacrum FPU1]GBF86028.1 molybdopterin-guanine dinucleotide biosynthesis protein MobA [Aphanothece sacrum FPU3]